MKTKLSLLAIFIAAIAVFTFDFSPRSSAQNKQKIHDGAVRVTVTEDRSARATYAPRQWFTVVNNDFTIPQTKKFFSSYGQPSINKNGLVVFRGRSTERDRESGIYMQQFPNGEVRDVADLGFLVPYPNNLNTLFTEFPAIPRIAMNTDNIAFRGNHKPVYKYLLPDGTETRAGTTGIYALLSSPLLVNGASKLGIVPGFEYYAVPNVFPRVAFGVFPGAPAINDDGTVVFKGNYSVDGVEKTGVFFRPLLNSPGGGTLPVEMIAGSDTEIPNTPPSAGFKITTFGSTAPPSVAGNEVVFVGLDNEDNPNYGGIYLTPLKPNPPLRELVRIGEPLPGLKIEALTRIGEGLSFDGNFVAFWGAWGDKTKTVRLYCPTDGNAGLIAYCNGIDPNSRIDKETGRWFQEKTVPVNQGIFVMDINAGILYMVSDTVSNFNDFVFWGYSGKAPGTGSDEDAEPPRWRAASFLSVADGWVVFKARTGILNDRNEYVNPVDGVYLGDALKRKELETLVETGMDGNLIDPMLQPRAMTVAGIGIERESLRGQLLAITATMANAEDSWGGIYVTNIGADQLSTKNGK